MSLFTQWVPRSWSDEPHHAELEAYADRVVGRLRPSWPPNLAQSILHRQVIGPYEMEHTYGLIGGNIFHGELCRRPAVPQPAGRRVRRLPLADRRALPGALGHPRRRRGVRHPGLAGGAGRAGRREARVRPLGARPHGCAMIRR